MAPETKAKKRKSAELSAPSSKKSKKSDAQSEDVAAPKPSKKANKTATASEEPLPAMSTKSKSSRKRAVDFFDGEEEGGVKLKPAAAPKSTKPKKVKQAEEPEETLVASTKTSSHKKSQKPVKDAPAPSNSANESTKRSKKQPTPEEPSDDDPADEVAMATETGDAHEEEGDDDQVDDQTAALLKGFESSSDEDDASEGEEDSVAIDKIPSLPNEKKLRKTLDAASKNESDGPGVVYVGRIPHGFYEHQMQAYFSQFGQITRLRLSRNAKTGRSKHYAFIEFAHASVARIVADTMDKYLMFGHILQVKLLSPEQVHPELFKGAGRRFKKVPRNKIEGRRLRLGMEREAWEGRIGREEKRRREKEEKVKAMGYDFEAPKLKSVGDVPMKDAATDGATAIETTDGTDAVKALPEAPHEDEPEKAAVETAKSEQYAAPEKAKSKSTKPKSSGASAEKAAPAKTTKKASGDVKVKKTKKAAP